jgi:hypothetical protein
MILAELPQGGSRATAYGDPPSTEPSPAIRDAALCFTLNLTLADCLGAASLTTVRSTGATSAPTTRVLRLLGYISWDHADWVQAHDRVPLVLAARLGIGNGTLAAGF